MLVLGYPFDIDSGLLSAVGYGKYQHVASNESEEGRAKNRRIEIVLIPMNGDRAHFKEMGGTVQRPSLRIADRKRCSGSYLEDLSAAVPMKQPPPPAPSAVSISEPGAMS